MSIYLTANYDDLLTFWVLYHVTVQGRIQDFKLGGAHLKKLRRAERGANILGVFRVKNQNTLMLIRSFTF